MSTTVKPGGHYSGKNPIPNIQKFIENLDADKKKRDAEIDAQNKAQKKEGKKPSKDSKSDVEHNDHGTHGTHGVKGTQKWVTDPTTGNEVQIEDVDANFMKAVDNPTISVPNANLGKETSLKTEATQSGQEYRETQDVTAPPAPIHPNSTTDVPIHGEKTNVLFHPTPSISYEPMFEALEQRGNALCAGIFVAIVVIGKLLGGSLWGLLPLGGCVASGVFLWVKELIKSGRNAEWSSEKERGETATLNLIPESVEWINNLLSIGWGLINPEMFAGVADMLEDIMQASVPGVIENVRVAEINQGTNPFRILSLRALPDSHVKEVAEEVHRRNAETRDPEEVAADESAGDYYNLECSFAYHAAPTGADVSSKARNMHMQLVFYLGVKGLFGVPLPIWVELEGLVGTVRLRLQVSPEPPYLKTLTFTLMGVPKIQAGCVPMVKRGVNILNLPLISNFVNYAIAAAAAEYVAPKSMTLDMGKMLQGDDIQKEVEALGILWIRIHKATGLSKQDRRGSEGGGSDPYITVSFSKYGKPMYCTRIIQDDLNPIWEETCALLVTPDLIKADEQLSMELWDSDRSTSDDLVGKVELSMQKMIQHPGKMYPQVSKLQGSNAEKEMPGLLHWEVGYFGKPEFRKELRTAGKDVNLPKELQDHPDLQDAKGAIDNEEEDAVIHTPPDPLWPSGICSVVVHQIVNLEYENIKGSDGKRKGREFEPAQPSGENKSEQHKNLPNSYCTICLNDELIYRTRAKVVSSKPIFNAGTERFVRDWRSAIVTITVRDQRMREHDPILGVVPLKLSDILQTSSQVTRWYPLDGGIGFGRVRISLLWRSIETKLPPFQLGWDVGTFEFTSKKIVATGYSKSPRKMKLRTGGSSDKVGKSQCKAIEGGDGIEWEVAGKTGEGSVRLPVKFRYRSPVIFEFHTSGKRDAEAYATIWLNQLEDNEEQDFDVPIWKTNNGMRLTQNFITEQSAKEVPDLKLEEVGRLKFRGRFKAGADEDHARFVVDNDTRETQETWEACFAEGVRSRVVTKELPAATRILHEQTMPPKPLDKKDPVPQVEGQREKWLAKDGTDWSGAFGEDPATITEERRQRTDSAKSGVNTPIAGVPKKSLEGDEYVEDDASDSSSSISDDVDLGIKEASTAEFPGNEEPSSEHSKNPLKQVKTYNSERKDLHRQQRGLMQWKPMRNLQFAKDEAKFAVRRALNVGSMSGRKPDVETETGS